MEQVVKAFEEEKKAIRTICAESGMTGIKVLEALNGRGSVRVFGKEEVLPLFKDLVGLGVMLVLVEHQGCVFEIKTHFPDGAEGHGYYNFKLEQETGISGHMDIKNISHVAVVSETFHNMESKNWWFIHENGEVMFKVYLGRNADRSLKENQLEVFNKWLNK